jgi:prolyl-tRNA synthetase
MNATFLDNQGEANALVMGCYGIGISRLVASVIEQTHDEGGLVWPVSVAPYPVHICQLGEGDEVKAAVEKIEKELTLAGYEPLVDDRDVRPGVKFKDADLIGIPFRITVGDRGLKDGVVELKPRTEKDPKASEAIPLSDISKVLIERIQKDLSTN